MLYKVVPRSFVLSRHPFFKKFAIAMPSFLESVSRFLFPLFKFIFKFLFKIVIFIPRHIWTRQEERDRGERSRYRLPRGIARRSNDSVLTLPLPAKKSKLWRRQRRTRSQSGSLLLSRVPLEIRQQIWKNCVGGMKIHISPGMEKNKLVLFRYQCCAETWDQDCLLACVGEWFKRDIEARKSGTPKLPENLLSIFLTCRQM